MAVIARKHLTTRSAIEAMARDNVRATVPSAPEASREPARPAAPLGTDLRAKITRRVTLK